jgi:hypothetical protein
MFFRGEPGFGSELDSCYTFLIEGQMTKTAINMYEDPDYGDFLPADIWTEVFPNLWQGGTDDDDIIGVRVLDNDYEPRITKDEFDVVVTLHAWSNPADWGVKELRYPFHDGVIGVDVSEDELFFIAKYVHDELLKGSRVLVRCLAGLNRSGLINVLVLVRRGYTVQEALDLVRSIRSRWVMCNEDFEKWLLSIDEANWRGDELNE